MNGISTGRPRIDVVDAQRGLAVLAIVLVHNLEHFIFPVYPADPPAWLAALDMWQKLAFTFVLVSSFVIMYRNARFSRMVSGLRFYGRMSLTNYVTQSVIGALVYFPFGLYLAPHFGYTLSLLAGVAVFILQMLFCRWWLSRHRQGPLEYVWHKWTWIGTGR